MLTTRRGVLVFGGRGNLRCDDDCERLPQPSPAAALAVAVGGAVIGAVLSPLCERFGQRLADRWLPERDEPVIEYAGEEEDDDGTVAVDFDATDGVAFRRLLDRERAAMDEESAS